MPMNIVWVIATEHFFEKLCKLLSFVGIWKTALCERCVFLPKDAFESAWLWLTFIRQERKQRWLVLCSVLLACELIQQPLRQGLLSRQWAWADANMGICGPTALKYFLESRVVSQKANFRRFWKGSVYV